MYSANQYYRPKQVGNVITRISRALLRVPYRVREPRHVGLLLLLGKYLIAFGRNRWRGTRLKRIEYGIEVIKAAALIVLRPLHVPQDVCITGERGETRGSRGIHYRLQHKQSRICAIHAVSAYRIFDISPPPRNICLLHTPHVFRESPIVSH